MTWVGVGINLELPADDLLTVPTRSRYNQPYGDRQRAAPLCGGRSLRHFADWGMARVMDALEQYAALERFILDNPDLERLESLSPRFNLFEFMGFYRQEGVHSQFLIWLLSPQENHGLGDDFLKRFLLQTLTRARQTCIKTAAPLGVVLADFSSAQVHPEWHNEVEGQRGYLDILILDERQKFYCAIENKVGSGEHSQQLTRYRLALEQKYPAPDFRRHYVFLSPGGTSALDVEERAYWTPVDYNLVCELVEETAQSLAGPANEDLRVFLRHYTDILRRHVLDNSEIRQLARTIYTQHRDAIELIYRYKPDYQVETMEILNEVIPENLAGLVWDSDNRNATIGVSTTRFFPSEWSDFASLKAETRWLGPSGSRSKSFLLIEVKLTRSNLSFNFTLNTRSSPESELIRQEMDARLTEVLGRGQSDGPHRVFPVGSNILNQSDFENWDEEAIRAKIEAWVSGFAVREYPRIRDAVSQCLAEFEE